MKCSHCGVPVKSSGPHHFVLAFPGPIFTLDFNIKPEIKENFTFLGPLSTALNSTKKNWTKD
jgi:hypothetical protein